MLHAKMSQKQIPRSERSTSTAQQALSCQQFKALAPAAAPHTALQQDQQQQWRLELFFKSQRELHAQLHFLRRHGITKVNLTNKSNDDQLLQSASFLQANTPGLDLCVHYSLKYNYSRSPAATLAKLQAFCSELQQMFLQAQQGKAKGSSSHTQHQQQQCHVLLVSGGGKKKVFDTVAALQQLAHHQQQQQQQAFAAPTAAPTAAHQSASKRQRTAAIAAVLQHTTPATTSSSSSIQPAFAVAFNPYLPDEAAAAEEVSRLRAKLLTGLVGQVYLQMGTDLQRLSWGLQQLQDICNELYKDAGSSSSSTQPLQLYGSVFIPSKQLLAQMRFRPWSGVYLSEEYLSSVAAAEAVTAHLLAAYAAAGVVPLIESAVKHDAELKHVMQLLQMGKSTSDSSPQQAA